MECYFLVGETSLFGGYATEEGAGYRKPCLGRKGHLDLEVMSGSVEPIVDGVLKITVGSLSVLVDENDFQVILEVGHSGCIGLVDDEILM